MGSRYLDTLADELRAAGLAVVEVAGWQTRARSSGGYDGGRPSCVAWHHTASSASLEADAAYCATGAADAPICNLVVGRDGTVAVIAAGATNTNGKGGPFTLADGTIVAADTLNTHAVGIELANAGTGETYPAAQVDAAFAASLVCSRLIGRDPANAVGHVEWAPGRKIDPATAAAVAGPWRPAAVNSAGSWSGADLRAELTRRSASSGPTEEDPPMTELWMTADSTQFLAVVDGRGYVFADNDALARFRAASPRFPERVVSPGTIDALTAAGPAGTIT